jgi:CRISPR-associated protein Cmr3
VLTTPGIFANGWRLPTDQAGRFSAGEVRGRVVAAQVARSQVVSGWDLAKWQPKPAERVAPTGSVYWLDELEASEESLFALQAQGLWPEGHIDAARRAEGFNRFTFASF